MKESIDLNEATLLRLANLRSRFKCKTLGETIDLILDPENQLSALIEELLNSTTRHQFFAKRSNKSLAKRKLTELGLYKEAQKISNVPLLEFFKEAVVEHSTSVVSASKRPKTEALYAELEVAYKKLKSEGLDPLTGRLTKETGISNRTVLAFLKAKHPDTYELTIRVGRGNGVENRIAQVKADMAAEKRSAALKKKPAKKAAKKTARKSGAK